MRKDSMTPVYVGFAILIFAALGWLSTVTKSIMLLGFVAFVILVALVVIGTVRKLAGKQ